MLGLIPCPPQIWLAVSPVDMRKGTDGLSAIVQQALGHTPCAGSAFVSCALTGHGQA
ncbi:IS66 family insertion sequence element accessory protein TnpB [Methylovulum psychrotolerans]|uniref:IS66 family insertion sequence element accessory protein TnpB n=1 Tax=Methylovulum psychrotolerans TaxID=1704499 RepID=UPI001BFFB0E9|nr:IS66 family insertion sequence element accessory protein TnpB [Methylovulum psychrotolerans]MBT9100236.1 IS66 family insertion sequence element accessory protein TnpB [Methylovulum psychrotolerans]